MIHHQFGAKKIRSGTGSPASQPSSSTVLRPIRSDRLPATKFSAPFTNPNEKTNATRNR